MNILSLFNGLGGLPLACDRAGISYDKCYYSEIDKYANKVMEKNYPDSIPLGDVTKWKEWDIDWSSIDLVSAGFPCQAWSVAGQQQGDKDERGMLFWTTLEVISQVLKHNPNSKFLMENVKMKKEFEQYITYHTEQALGDVEKILINSALVSAQNRNRYYWTNFEVTQPDDRGLFLRDILDISTNGFISLDESNYTERCKKQIKKNSKTKDQKAVALCTNSNITGSGVNVLAIHGGAIRCSYNEDGTISQRLELSGTEKTNTLTTVQKDNVVVRATVQANAEHTYNGKSPTLTASMGVGGGNVPLLTDYETSSKYKGKYIDKHERLEYRKLTPLECERLQTLPDNWTDCVSNTQRYKMIGNGWTIDVIAHILKHINN